MNRNLITSAAVVLIAALLLSISGCCSIGTRMELPPEDHYPYMGVAADLQMMEFLVGYDPSRGPMAALVWGLIDLPPSFVVDTVLLPVDLIHAMEKEK
jgi:uncharacterized protein YceK